MFSVVISAMTIGIALFSLCLITTRHRHQGSFPLAIVLISFSVISVGPMIFAILPNFITLYIAILPPTFFVLIPGIWFYHQALTSKLPWKWKKRFLWKFAPVPVAAIVSLLVMFLPQNEFEQMFFTNQPLSSLHARLSAIGFFIALLGWCCLSLIYAIKIFKRTLDYHRHLEQVFSNKRGKTLWWVQAITLLIIFTWFYALIVLMFDNRLALYGLSEEGVLLLVLVVVWSLSAFGLHQQPGFAEIHAATVDTSIEQKEPARQKSIEFIEGFQLKKYQRSALQESDLKRIAKKLTDAVHQDQLYLDPNLNLLKLADFVGAPNQYVSQTFTQFLGTNFFDYINHARIEAAKPLLIQGEEKVVDIAIKVGFNARSSFYKAFKTSTGMTPGEFKKVYQSDSKARA